MHQRSIGKRIFVWVIGILIASTMASIGWEFYAAIKQMEKHERAALVDIIESLTPSIEVALWEVDEGTLSTISDSIRFRPEVSYVEFEANNSTIFSHEDKNNNGGLSNLGCSEEIRFDFRDSEHFGQPLNTGQLRICMASNSLSRLDPKAILIAATPRFLTILIVAFSVLYIVQKIVIKRLIAISKQLRSDETFSVPEHTKALLQKNTDELDQLVIELAFRTTRLEEAQMKIIHTEKVEAVGRLTSGVAHEFNNILAVVLANLEMLKSQDKLPEKSEHYVNNALASINRAADVTNQLLIYASPSRGKSALVEISSVLPTIKSNCAPFIGSGIQFSLTSTELNMVNVNKTDLENAIVNLVKNSSEALEGEGKISVQARPPTAKELTQLKVTQGKQSQHTEYVVITVEDDGPGIPNNVQQNLFNPFFTTKTASGGTGLGLWTAYRFAEQSGGHLIHMPAALGTRFLLFLPQVRDQQPAPIVNPEARPVSRTQDFLSSHSILIVDDEEELLELMESATANAGPRTFTATSIEQALNILETENICLVVCDYALGDGFGTTVCEYAKRKNKKTKTLLISGNLPEHANISTAIDVTLLKPVSLEKYFDGIRTALQVEEPPPLLSIH